MGKISEKKLKEINHWHAKTTDKWYRMYAGVSTDLINYKDDVAHIKVKNTESRLKSDEALSTKVIEAWKSTLKRELPDTKGFVVDIYKTNKPTGFSIPFNAVMNEGAAQNLIDGMKVEEELTLVGTFSGSIPLK